PPLDLGDVGHAPLPRRDAVFALARAHVDRSQHRSDRSPISWLVLAPYPIDGHASNAPCRHADPGRSESGNKPPLSGVCVTVVGVNSRLPGCRGGGIRACRLSLVWPRSIPRPAKPTLSTSTRSISTMLSFG